MATGGRRSGRLDLPRPRGDITRVLEVQLASLANRLSCESRSVAIAVLLTDPLRQVVVACSGVRVGQGGEFGAGKGTRDDRAQAGGTDGYTPNRFQDLI